MSVCYRCGRKAIEGLYCGACRQDFKDEARKERIRNEEIAGGRESEYERDQRERRRLANADKT